MKAEDAFVCAPVLPSSPSGCSRSRAIAPRKADVTELES